MFLRETWQVHRTGFSMFHQHIDPPPGRDASVSQVGFKVQEEGVREGCIERVSRSLIPSSAAAEWALDDQLLMQRNMREDHIFFS